MVRIICNARSSNFVSLFQLEKNNGIKKIICFEVSLFIFQIFVPFKIFLFLIQHELASLYLEYLISFLNPFRGTLFFLPINLLMYLKSIKRLCSREFFSPHPPKQVKEEEEERGKKKFSWIQISTLLWEDAKNMLVHGLN